MSDLPIQQVLAELITALDTTDSVVLEAPPGAGKTTGVPLQLLNASWLASGQKILMLEPRRLAARAAAERMAQVLGEPVGQTVGYRVRLDKKISASTRIEVVTEGILTRQLQDDPALENVALVIFDEFHERSLDADLGLALCQQGRTLFTDLREQPLKLLVMSATLDGVEVSELLNDAPVVSSEGRMFPVAVRYGDPLRYGEKITERVAATIKQALQEQRGSVLVFLPGRGEIRQAHQHLVTWLESQPDSTRKSVLLTPLFGDLSLNEQRRAIAPAPQGQRKVVLATAIAESSLTIEGVRVVVDCGLSRQPTFDPNTGMTRLTTNRVSKASATQRAGRAGRLEPGVCYRLWSEQQQDQLSAFTPAEIQHADLAPLALQLLNWGVVDPAELCWLNPPATAPYQQALDLLERLGAVTSRGVNQWQLTDHGKHMAAIPVHPRLAHMLVMAQRHGLITQACRLAALLGERDLLYNQGADILRRLELVSGEIKAEYAQRGLIQRIKQQQQQYQRIISRVNTRVKETLPNPGDPGWTGLLLAWAYPDRIARQRRDGGREYLLSNGRAAGLAEHDILSRQRWLAIAQSGGLQGRSQDKIFMAAEFNPQWFDQYLSDQIIEEIVIDWDERAGRMVAEKRRRLGSVLVETKPLDSIDPQARAQALLGLVSKRGLGLFTWTDELQQWRARVELMRQIDGEGDWPDVSDSGLLATLEIWLVPYLDSVSTLNHFKQLNLSPVLQALLSWAQLQKLDKLAPERLTVPSGSNIRIDYTQSPPVLAVKLQEMFGCQSTPSIVNGKLPLMVHLLSPARRPLQVTQDLAGFWRGSYYEVKKEMKGRYPKHPWPDDPSSALATVKTKKRM